jgi:hypothetical protein
MSHGEPILSKISNGAFPAVIIEEMLRTPILALLLVLPAAAQSIVPPAQLTPGMMDFNPAQSQPLACEVIPIRPMLNFSFRFQGGYVVRVPMSQYPGKGHLWVVLARITPEGGEGKPVYLGSRMRLPEIPPTKTQMEFTGGYFLGEGRYQAALKMWDDAGRVCIRNWKIDARLTHAERKVKVSLPAGNIADLTLRGAPRGTGRDDAPPIRLTVLMHASPVSPRRMQLSGRDRVMLLGTLSSLLDRLPARSVRLVVFNLDQQKELYRNEQFGRQGMDQVALSLNAIQLAKVDYDVLKNKSGHLDLLSDLIRGEFDSQSPSDIVVFLGPMSRFLDKVPSDELERPAGAAERFYYLQYRSIYPQPSTFPDVITRAVAKLKGRTMIIRSPGDFANAIDQIEHK